MGERIKLSVNGRAIEVPAGAMVSAAVAISGARRFRRSVTGQPRAPLCGMGICYECRVTIDGRAHAKSCQIPCEEGMEVSTDA
jgi:D-hydroxyproline dehydrogenase subunit gamma